MDRVAAAPSLIGQSILRHAGRDYSVTAIGVDAPREARVTEIVRDMVQGSFEALASNANGLLIGQPLADKMGVGVGDSVTAVTTTGAETALKIVGVFRTGIDAEDQTWAITGLARQEAMQAKPRVVNQIHVRLADFSVPARTPKVPSLRLAALDASRHRHDGRKIDIPRAVQGLTTRGGSQTVEHTSCRLRRGLRSG
jgi:ABC-type lipoprotein release transport system permease subunit